jgi:SAM-dependent methyltransferase
MIPDWQLPQGVDRGLWDYLHASDMVAGYDEAMSASPLAAADVTFCERAFPTPGRLLDLGCGTGRLCLHFAGMGYECIGVDLSDEMLARAKDNLQTIEHDARYRVRLVTANITDATLLEGETFDYAACLFSTLGMVRGAENRARVIANAFRLLKPGGRFLLHAHNRFFRGLGLKRVLAQRMKTLLGRTDAGDITMPQAYAGAPLTLHHFTRREVVEMLETAGFVARKVMAVGDDGMPASQSRVYGWLILAEREMT